VQSVRRYFFAFCIISSLIFFSHPAMAVFQLTATPSDGGYDLRFGKIAGSDFKVAKEVTVRAASDIGRQYRVFLRIIQPVSTQTGVEIAPDQFRMYPRVGSSTLGTLLYTEEVPISRFDTIVYTSNDTGTGDSFQLVFTVTPKPDQMAGSYNGRMAFVLVPVNGNESQVIVYVNVSVELGGGAVAAVEIGTQTGQRRILVKSQKGPLDSDQAFADSPQVGFKVHGPLGTRYRIFQKLEGSGALISDKGDNFSLAEVKVVVDGGRQGTPEPPDSLRAAASKQLLYTSDNDGSADQFIVAYKPENAFRLQKPGLYRGRLDYILETEGSNGVVESKVLDTYDLDFDVVSLFDIYVTSSGVEGVDLRFGEVSYKTGPKTSSVDVFLVSNLGGNYQVVQKIFSPMMNEAGDKVPEKDFTVKAEVIEAKEAPRSMMEQEAPVKEGETVVFDSGPEGASAHVKLTYKLTMRPDSKGGRYGAQLGYSLVQK
jgi:hypothetical protein